MPVSDLPLAGLPRLSILVAARNEENTILACLQAIAQLDEPDGSFEVLIGNDQSTDQTANVVATFIADRPAFRLISISAGTGQLRGKANVLAQLARQARGHYLLFTDADTCVPPGWARAMLASLTGKPPAGIVTGVTLPEGSTVFSRLQAIDWLLMLTLAHGLSRGGVPTTAMGNNMAVSRAAYASVGGYESLPFSVVEDYALFRAVIGQGFGFQNRLDTHVLAHTRPVPTLRGWLHQRKRWMRGATDLSGWLVGALYVHYLAGPLLLGLGWFWPVPAILLYVSRLLVQTLVIGYGLTRLRQHRLWPYVLLFEPYQLLIGPLAVLFYGLPTRFEWKGRWYT